MQVMSCEVIACIYLQALAASRATRVPPDRRVSRVRGHSFHHINQVLVLCLGDVIDASDEW